MNFAPADLVFRRTVSRTVATMAKHKPVLTTGEIAKICNVAPRTVSKWFDAGQLRGYRIPGSRDRRVPVDQLVRFMRAHGIPLNGLEDAVMRVAVADADPNYARTLCDALSGGEFDLRTCSSVFELGYVCGLFRPRVALVDVSMPGFSSADFFRAIASQPDAPSLAAVAVCPDSRDAERQRRIDEGFDACIGKPFEPSAAIDAIQKATGPRE